MNGLFSIRSSAAGRAGGDRGIRSSRDATNPSSVERHRLRFAAFIGSFANASFSVALPLPEILRPRGPIERHICPSAHRNRSTALMGFGPSQVSSRRRVIAAFLSDRAHVSFLPARPPRFIFVGVIAPPFV